MSPEGYYYVMGLYSLISIMHAQFGIPTSTKNSKTKLQTLQNKCLCFCLQLDNRAYVGITEFKKINCLPADHRCRQCFAANTFKVFDERCPFYMKNVFDKSCINQASTRSSTMNLSQPLRRTSYGQNCTSFVAPSVWNNLPNELKRCTNQNTFKYKVKEQFF